jgi:hypothetical protein
LKNLNEKYQNIFLGKKFINAHLYRYCLSNKISFTMSRKYRKNDNCYVEQKNYSVVQRLLESTNITNTAKKKLKEQYELLNPAELYRQIARVQEQLIEMITYKKNLKTCLP